MIMGIHIRLDSINNSKLMSILLILKKTFLELLNVKCKFLCVKVRIRLEVSFPLTILSAMDDLMLSVLEEISINGADGIRLGSLWENLEIVDIHVKRYIWIQLFQIESVTISRINGNMTTAVTVDDYNEDDVRLTAASYLYRPALGISDPAIQLTKPQYKLMRQIASNKSNGLLQSDVSKINQVDARTIFYHLRLPIEYGLIQRKNITERNTNLLTLSRYTHYPASLSFFSPNEFEDDTSELSKELEDGGGKQLTDYSKAICNYLDQHVPNAQERDETLRSIFHISSQRFQFLKRYLIRKGFVEQVRLRDPQTNTLVAGMHLLRPYEEELKANLVVELPLLYQLYATIASAGADGVRQNDLVHLCHNPPRYVVSAIQQLTGHFNIVPIRHNVGKTSTFRLFCRECLEPTQMITQTLSSQTLAPTLYQAPQYYTQAPPPTYPIPTSDKPPQNEAEINAAKRIPPT